MPKPLPPLPWVHKKDGCNGTVEINHKLPWVAYDCPLCGLGWTQEFLEAVTWTVFNDMFLTATHAGTVYVLLQHRREGWVTGSIPLADFEKSPELQAKYERVRR